MSSSSHQRHAVVLVPHGKSVTGNIAKRIWKYCTGRDYELIALVRDWPAAGRMLDAGQANIVVMQAEEPSPAADGETVRLWPDAEPGAEAPTRDLGAVRRRAAGNSRFVSGRLPRERVRELLDGPGEVTGPMGIDPETIAAARRIARSLDERPSL